MEQNKIYIDYLKNFGYMQDINRSDRVKKTQEVFTPINACIDLIEHTMKFTDNMLYDTVFDNCVGDGEWLGAVLIKRLEAGIDLQTAVSTLRGCDLQTDNVKRCHKRLSCGNESLYPILRKNIVASDSLRYHYRWDNTAPYDDEVKEQEFEKRLNSLFDFD